MTLLKTTILIAGVLALSTAAMADGHEGDEKKHKMHDKMNAGNAPTMDIGRYGLMPWGFYGPVPTPWSLFDPYLLDMPGGGKGLPVHGAKDPSKIIGYLKMPALQKPKGPVHCMIKETGLLAKSVDDCEAAGGTVAK